MTIRGNRNFTFLKMYGMYGKYWFHVKKNIIASDFYDPDIYPEHPFVMGHCRPYIGICTEFKSVEILTLFELLY
jgi:hypothetical protein